MNQTRRFNDPQKYIAHRKRGMGYRIENFFRSNRHAKVVLVILVILIAVFTIQSCTTKTQINHSNFGFDKTYDWSNLKNNNGRLSYVVDGQSESQLGIDVSEHQGFIDWNAVKNDGIQFAFIRLGNRGSQEGQLNQDEYFNYNVSNASAAGLDVGVYFFSQAVNENEAREEAHFVIERLSGKPITFPVVFDHEHTGTTSRVDGLSVEQMTANAKTFCEEITKAGYNAMIYGSSRDLMRYDLTELSHFGIWYAQYTLSAPSMNKGFTIWQYSNSGRVDGIDGKVDMDLRFLP